MSLILIYMKAILHCRQPIIDTIMLIIILKPSIYYTERTSSLFIYIFHNSAALVELC